MEMKDILKEALEKGTDVSKSFLEKAKELAKDLGEKGQASLELLYLEKEYKDASSALGLYVYSSFLESSSITLSGEDQAFIELVNNLKALEKDLQLRRTRLEQ